MQSVEQRFGAFKRDSLQGNSSFVYFVRAIQNQPLTKRRVVFYFNKLVEKTDYDTEDKREIVDFLTSKIATQKQGFFGEKGYKTTLDMV